jgi:two-component system chemotaxis response regulator CheB
LADNFESQHPAPVRRIVAIASSAGGLNALTWVLSPLPADFPAAILIVQHLDPNHPSHMADILGRKTKIPVKQAENDEYLSPAIAYFAPPDRHLLVDEDGRLSLSSAALVSYVRPSADLLFESVAGAFGTQAIAVVLTGSGSDGAAGVRAISIAGGYVIAQSEESAEYPSMPHAAIGTGVVNEVLPLDHIPTRLTQLVMGS